MRQDNNASIGTVYQINESASSACYVGCLIISSEVKSWGIQGYIASPGSFDTPPGLIYLRCPWDWLEHIGQAVLVAETEEVCANG